jgi:hypothetical protein
LRLDLLPPFLVPLGGDFLDDPGGDFLDDPGGDFLDDPGGDFLEDDPGDLGGDFLDDDEEADALLELEGFMIVLNRLSAHALIAL